MLKAGTRIGIAKLHRQLDATMVDVAHGQIGSGRRRGSFRVDAGGHTLG